MNNRYPPELRERAVRMVYETIAQSGQRHGAIAKVAKQLGIGRESVSHWVNRKEVDEGKRPGLSTDDKQRLLELERENVELRRANEILKAACGGGGVSSRGSSTRHSPGSHLHRRAQGQPHLWASLGNRADLQGAAVRPFHLLRGQDQAAVCSLCP
jgi:transposase